MDFLSMLGDSKDALASGLAMAQAAAFVAVTYFFIQWDKNRTGSPNKDDTQVGLKLVLFAIIIASITILTGGLEHLLAFVLGGFKGGSMFVRGSLPPIIVGAGAIFFVLKMLLPRTNHAQFPQAARYTVGWLALVYGVASVVHVYGFLMGLFTGAEWFRTSAELGASFVSIALAFPAMRSFGAMSGWVEPPPPPAPQYGYPGGPSGPNMGNPGYPPGGGSGYGPPGGGVPGGGMPPGGSGGYGPPGGGGAPPGGGYGGGGAPPGGGGYGPPGGGGAPPGGGYGGGGAPPGGGYGPGGGSGGFPPR